MGAYGLGAFTAFAVAVALLVSVSSTADAQAAPDHTLANTDTSVSLVAPGDTVRIEVASAFAQVSITGTASGVGGSFDANDGQSISCGDGASCDKDTDASEVAVDLTVDADAGEGHILLSVGGLGATTSTKVINVTKSTLVGSIAIKAVSSTIAASDNAATAGVTENETVITVNVKNASSPPLGRNGETVTLITTLGTISCDGSNYTQACTTSATANSSSTPGVADDQPGWATVTLRGGGVEGVARITATKGSLTQTISVTFYGSAKNLAAEPMQGSVEIGESVYIVLTVTDAAGNPVSGATIDPGKPDEVVGPADKAVLVTTAKDTTANDATDGSGYNMDFIHATDSKKSIPACGDDKDPVTDSSATPPTTEDFADNGTNDDGQCVVYVSAPDESGTDKDATRGPHTLHFVVNGAATVKATATVEVAGKPASITTDAPAMVDVASVTKITVSVFDDEDVLVGDRDVNIRKVGGDGLVEDAQASTTNGKATFNFIAPSSVGSSEILITAGDVNHRVTLQIGEAPEEPAPEISVSGQSGSIGVLDAGSLGDLLGALDCGGNAGTTVTIDGNTYVVGAPGPVNSAFLENVSFPIAFGGAFVNCR